jgi:hypothetical protein
MKCSGSQKLKTIRLRHASRSGIVRTHLHRSHLYFYTSLQTPAQGEESAQRGRTRGPMDGAELYRTNANGHQPPRRVKPGVNHRKLTCAAGPAGFLCVARAAAVWAFGAGHSWAAETRWFVAWAPWFVTKRTRPPGSGYCLQVSHVTTARHPGRDLTLSAGVSVRTCAKSTHFCKCL